MANPDRARKLLMRTALVTSSTIATLIGAQNLAMLDASRWQQSATPSQDTTVLLPAAATAMPQGTAIAGTEAVAIQQAAPSITILRQPGQVQAASPAQSGGSAPTNHTAQIQPPSPVQLAAPAPQIIQQPQAVYQPVPQQGSLVPMKRLYYFEFRAMGCLMTAQLETHADGTDLLAQLPEKVEAIEARLSRFRPESELMRLNARAGEWVAVSDVLFDAVHAAKHAARLTDGLYNPLVLPAMLANGYDRSFEQIDQPAIHPAVPAADWRGIGLRVKTREVRLPAGSAIDLGGIGKGWTAARLTDDLGAHGACLVNLGGDITAQGSPENLPGWHVNIEDPHSGQSFIALWLQQGTVVTSGIDYRRWVTADGQTHHHIVHPMTGLPAQTDIVSATVIHPHAPTAEAYAKAVLLKGSMDGLNWLQQRWYAAGMVIRHDGGVLATSNFDHFTHERIIS